MAAPRRIFDAIEELALALWDDVSVDGTRSSTHTIDGTSVDEVDAEVVELLKASYAQNP
ncbi:MAG: hypothetical protein ABJA81_00325 [Nocardioidaceae bacterium]